MGGRILIVDDEKIAVKNLEHVMKKEGYQVVSTQSGPQALTWLEKQTFDVVLTDLRMEKIDGMQILKRCRESYPETEVILITGFATLESAVQAMKQGAFYYIAKPFRLDEVRKVVTEAMEKIRLKQENRCLREQLDCYHGKVRMVTQNAPMHRLLEMARQIAPTDCNVFLTGESGTGKELVARYVHFHSHRATGPFVALNCGALSEELLANELFGHMKGAFTGAISDKPGLIETASGGTLFLDEITEMSLAMQVKLLRVIQEREVLRVGGLQTSKIDVRFIAASNRDIHAAVKQDRLREDLYFRLNVVNLSLPPLASRPEDIPLLALYFLQKYAALMHKEVVQISPEALEILKNYSFPGNVRELENIIERGVALSHETVLDSNHLPDELRKLSVLTFRRKEGRIPTLDEQEHDYIQWVLTETHGNQTTAAQLLGIDRVSLWRKLKKYGEKS